MFDLTFRHVSSFIHSKWKLFQAYARRIHMTKMLFKHVKNQICYELSLFVLRIFILTLPQKVNFDLQNLCFILNKLYLTQMKQFGPNFFSKKLRSNNHRKSIEASKFFTQLLNVKLHKKIPKRCFYSKLFFCEMRSFGN